MRKRFVTHCYQFLFCFNQRPVPTNPDTFETAFLTLTRIRVHLGCVQTDATLLTNNFQHCWMLHVASVCTPCCMLLDVVACCCAKFETGQTFSPVQTDATLLAYNSQHCWELLRPFARSLTLESGFKKVLSFGLTDFVWGKSRFVKKYMQF